VKKKKRKTGNTAAKTMGWLRKKGYLVAKVERWNPFVGIRQDLFGFIDIIALHPDHTGVLGVQTTAGSFLEEHKTLLTAKTIKKGNKVKPNPVRSNMRTWLLGHNRLWIFGWGKHWQDGIESKRWAPELVDVTLGVSNNNKFYFSSVEEFKNVDK